MSIIREIERQIDPMEPVAPESVDNHDKTSENKDQLPTKNTEFLNFIMECKDPPTYRQIAAALYGEDSKKAVARVGSIITYLKRRVTIKQVEYGNGWEIMGRSNK